MADTGTTETFEAPQTIRRMLSVAATFLDSLSPELRAQAWLPMDHVGRGDWDFIPKPDRTGVPMVRLDRHQRTIAHTLLRSGLSLKGYTKALSIMALENILRELEVERHGIIAGDFRSPDNYFITVFGRPAFEDTWGWRFLGHHLSLSYTIVDQQYLSVTPCNMGAQPASAGVLNPLGEDESLGFELLHSLPEDARRRAIIHDVAPADYATRQVALLGKVEYPDYWDLGIPWYQITDADREALKFVKDSPSGLPASEMPAAQAKLLTDLVSCFVERMPEEVAGKHMDRIRADGPDQLWFAWAGQQQPGTSHYYRIHGRQILIEFDNAIDNGNHIHSVWRDFRNDLGHDLLLDHYERVHRQGHHLATRLESSVPDE
jgi:hypothetical protein